MRRNATPEVDVAVLGGGPAGAATALALARLGLSVLLIERTHYDSIRIGETLPPKIRLLLGGLGVWETFLAQNHCRSFSTYCAWGQTELYANDFIFNAYGSGWHVDRARFDAMLAKTAEDAGVVLLQGAQVTYVEQCGSSGWRLEIRAEKEQLGWHVKFLVDATGRASTVARHRGAIRTSYDHLVAVVAFFAPDSRASTINHSTLVEAVENGWWYSALLPHGETVVAFMTDADIYARASKNSCHRLEEQLQQTTHTKARINAKAPTSVAQVVSANSSCLDKSAGNNWLAVGDAAMAFDPLCGQGVYKALESGIQGAEAIRDILSGTSSSFVERVARQKQHFDRYLTMRARYYGHERRWPDSLFWKRRQARSSIN